MNARPFLPVLLCRLAYGLLLIAPMAHSTLAQTNELPFTRLSVEDGLSQSAVFTITQDRQGFLWFGTQDGLNRYDGYRFIVFEHEAQQPGTLSANWISTLEADQDGSLWAGTYGSGLNHFDPTTGTFTLFRHEPDTPNSLSNDFVSDLLQGRDGSLWIGTYGGLNRLDPTTGQFTHYRYDPGDPNSLSNNRALVLAEDDEGFLWVGTDEGGLNRLDPATGQFTHYRYNPRDPNSLSGNVVLSLYVDRTGVLWAGTAENGLNKLVLNSDTFTHFRHDPDAPNSLSNNRVLSITEDAEGVHWVGTEGGGLNQLDADTGRFTRFMHDPADPHSLSNNVVTSIFTDRQGTRWVGTSGGGLNKMNRFTHYRNRAGAPYSLNNNHVLALYEDARGVIWVGTDGGGLNRFDPGTKRFTAYRHAPRNAASLSHDRVLHLSEEEAGILWVATGDGLSRFDTKTEAFTTYRHNPDNPRSLSNNRAITAYHDRDGTLWVGTWGGGLNRFDPDTETFTTYRHNPDNPRSLSNNRVITAYEDRTGTLWVGTFGGGLNRLEADTGGFTRFLHDPNAPASLSNDIVAALYEDRQGRLWIGTGEGLNRFDPKTETFTIYTKRDGLPNNTVYGILEDERGRLWLSTNAGLSSFVPDTGTFVNYDVADGLQSNEFSQGAYTKSPSGHLLFGGINGFNRFHPDDVRDRAPPPVVLTAFSLGDAGDEQLVPAGLEAFTLMPGENSFAFEFAALDYTNPSRNRYAYRLEGFDPDWHYADAGRRYAAYPNLPGGAYTFRVKAAGSNGVWTEAGVAVAITVVPPFWATWWFRLLAGAGLLGLFGGLAFVWHRVRIGRVERMRDEQAEIYQKLTESREAERLRLAQELHDGAMQDLYGVRFQLGIHTGDGEAAVLGQEQEMVQDVIRKLRDICGELRPPALAPFGLERALQSHTERFRETYPDLDVTLDLAPDGRVLPDPTRLALYRVYQEAMNNVVKHAAAKHVHVRLSFPTGKILLEVRDDGRGFRVPARWIELGRQQHYGLLGLAERALALGGSFDVTSAPGEGTTVRVTAPQPEAKPTAETSFDP